MAGIESMIVEDTKAPSRAVDREKVSEPWKMQIQES